MSTLSADQYNVMVKKSNDSKYKNVKVQEDGYTFDSKAEHRRYQELKLLQAAGEIELLAVHLPYELWVHGTKVATYISDFNYYLPGTDTWMTEDVKSTATRTASYRLKKKLMKACHDIDVIEVTA